LSITYEFVDWFNKLDNQQKELWDGTITYLMGHSFLLRTAIDGLSTKKEEAYYRFLEDNLEPFGQFFSVMNGRIEHEASDGIIRLVFPEHLGQKRFSKEQVFILLLLRQLYEKKLKDDFYSLSYATVTLTELMQMLQARNLQIPTSRILDYFQAFKKYRIASVVGEKGSETIIIAKTIIWLLPSEVIMGWKDMIDGKKLEESPPSPSDDEENGNETVVEEESVSTDEEEADEEKDEGEDE
jgi:hypothetical protein